MRNTYFPLYNGFLLQFDSNITGFYYGYYGTFHKDFVDSGPRPPKGPEALIFFGKKLEKLGRYITNITEYYGY